MLGAVREEVGVAGNQSVRFGWRNGPSLFWGRKRGGPWARARAAGPEGTEFPLLIQQLHRPEAAVSSFAHVTRSSPARFQRRTGLVQILPFAHGCPR